MINKLRNSLPMAAAVLVSIFLMLVGLAYTAPKDMFSFINADSMFFHALYNDLFIDGACLWGWDLNTTFNLMPNAVLYLISLLIVNDAIVSQIIHGVLQYGLFLWSVWFMLKSLKPQITNAALATSALLPVWFFIEAMYKGSFFLASQFFHPYHFGALIMACFAFGLNVRQMQQPSFKYSVLIISIVALSTFSNQIFLVMFVFPWLFSLVYKWFAAQYSKAWLMRNAAINIAGTVGGILLFLLIKNLRGLTFHETKVFSWSNIMPSFHTMWTTYKNFFTESPQMAGIILVSLIVFILAAILLIKNFRKKDCGIIPDNYCHFLVFTLFFVPMVFLAPAINGMFLGMASSRYNFYVMVWLLVCAGPLLQLYGRGKPWQQKFHAITFSMVLLIIILAGWGISRGSRPVDGLRLITGYSYLRADCVDQASELYDLKDGVGIFWDAKPVTAFSKQGIRVRQVYPDLRPYYLGVNRNWYFPYCQGGSQPVFNFIIHDKGLSGEEISNVFGSNIDTLQLQYCTIYLVPDFIYLPNRTIEVTETGH